MIEPFLSTVRKPLLTIQVTMCGQQVRQYIHQEPAINPIQANPDYFQFQFAKISFMDNKLINRLLRDKTLFVPTFPVIWYKTFCSITSTRV